MSVFISYNHNDSEFVDQLALALLKNNVKVWKDEWKIKVGDSLIDKIQQGIEDASYLIVVLSENSVKSDWVKKELNAGLIREIDDKKLTILPVVISNCSIPLFLREKLYADFRDSFDNGVKKILNVVSQTYNLDGGGRVVNDTGYYFDYAIENGYSKRCFFMNIDIVSFDKNEEFSILTQFKFLSNEYEEPLILDHEFSKELKMDLLRGCAAEFSRESARIIIKGNNPNVGRFTLRDKDSITVVEIRYNIKRLGVMTGGSVIFNVGALFGHICNDLEIKYA